jgi:hypothetical protein
MVATKRYTHFKFKKSIEMFNLLARRLLALDAPMAKTRTETMAMSFI